MDMTRPSSGHDQAEDPIKIHHPEEEEHHESRASKMFGKVKARAKKFKNSLTKHGNEHDVVDEVEDDESDEPEPEKHVAPVNEVSDVTGHRTSQPESLSHPRETIVTAPEKIIPSETKDSNTVYSSDETKRFEPEPLRDASYEHEAPSYPIKTSDVSERENSRDSHHVPLNTPVSLLSPTEDVTTRGEDEFLGGEREVNTERPTRLEDDLSVKSTYQPKIHHTKEVSGAGVFESLDQKSGLGTKLESEYGIEEDSPARYGGESETELGKDLPTRSFGFDEKTESGIDNHSPSGFGGKPETEPREDFPAKSHDFDQKIESGIGSDSQTSFGGKPEAVPRDDFWAKSHDFDQQIESETGKDSPTRFGWKPEAVPRDDFSAKSHDFDQKIESGIGNDSPTRFGGKPEAVPRDDFLAKSHDFDQQIESGIGKDSPTIFSGKQETELREDFPAKSHEFEQTIGSDIGKDTGSGKAGTERREDFLGKNYEFDQEMESAMDKNPPTRLGGESGQEEVFPTRSDDVKVETGLGRDLPTGTNDQFSPEFSGPKERNDLDSQSESQEPKPTTYTEMIGSAAISTKNAVVSSLGYSGETAGEQHESPVGVETVNEKLTADEENVKDTTSPVVTKLPLSGGGNGAEEREQGEDKGVLTSRNLAEKMTPEEEDKAFSEMVSEKLNLGEGEKKTATTKEVEVPVEEISPHKLPEEKEHGEGVAEEGNGGGGMVDKIKGAYSYWLGGGTTEEVKPKSPVSVEESSQSLGSTIGTKGFSDSGESGLGETGGSTGALPVQKGL